MRFFISTSLNNLRRISSDSGTFQVLAFSGNGGGMKEGTLVLSRDDPKVLFDVDFDGLEPAKEKYAELARQAGEDGFRAPTMIELLQFENS
jgi:hypothetical protein